MEPLPEQPKAPTTTTQEDLTVAGQRRVNLIWEYTQSAVSIGTVLTTMVSAVISQLEGHEVPIIIAVAFGTIIGFYFSRTNHQAIGGIGAKANESQDYTGR